LEVKKWLVHSLEEYYLVRCRDQILGVAKEAVMGMKMGVKEGVKGIQLRFFRIVFNLIFLEIIK
jgi:hypothetical protein